MQWQAERRDMGVSFMDATRTQRELLGDWPSGQLGVERRDACG